MIVGHGGRSGQATTEVVLLIPLFIFFMFAFVKIFGLLILVQRMEIASYYAARRWQLESHRNTQYQASFDMGPLLTDIQNKVQGYLGWGSPELQNLFALANPGPTVTVQPTEVWNVVTLTVPISEKILFFKVNTLNTTMTVTKYVPNRDRPILFRLPGGGS